MLKRILLLSIVGTALLRFMSGCTAHLAGEQEERSAAMVAGKPFLARHDLRKVQPLPDNPSPDDLVNHALLANAEVEQKYWEWKSAIEQIPQDGTQATNLALSASLNFSRGSTNLSRTLIGAGNDPMADLVLPVKLSVASHRALENARAAGMRFRKSQFDVRNKVLAAYLDYAMTAELARLQKSYRQLLQTTAMLTEARNTTGNASQQDVLKAANEVDLAGNDIAAFESQLIAQRAGLNALLDRPTAAPLPAPPALPANHAFALSDEQVFTRVSTNNPDLAALRHDAAGKNNGIELARLQYLPDVSIGANSDLKGLAQSLLGLVTVPWMRHEAIDAAVAQAQANLAITQAMRRQVGNDINALVVLDLNGLRDADRQLDLFSRSILPRARQTVDLARASYESGHGSLLDMIDNQRSLISIQRLELNLHVARAKHALNLETVMGQIAQ